MAMCQKIFTPHESRPALGICVLPRALLIGCYFQAGTSWEADTADAGVQARSKHRHQPMCTALCQPRFGTYSNKRNEQWLTTETVGYINPLYSLNAGLVTR